MANKIKSDLNKAKKTDFRPRWLIKNKATNELINNIRGDII